MSITHDFDFDPTYGYTLEAMLKIRAPEPPQDFLPFWEKTYEEALAQPLNMEKRAVPGAKRGWNLYEIYYDSWEGVRIGGWLLEPAEGPVTGAIVMGHGYGGREEPEYEWLMPQMAAIFPCARGFHLSACAGIPSVAAEHVVHRIESREDYVIRGCAADLWLAASAVLELYPQVRDNLLYIGGSFGGGMGALMLSVDKRFRRAYLNIPTFGHHPLRITLPCVGSGAAVRSYYLEGHPEVLDVLAYYDAAVAAGFIEIPVYVAAALFDPAVPPPGQFAVYNMLSHHKELFLRQADHFELEGNQYDNACVRTRVRRFFRD